jgi:RimJ/RimL family protein N-acetyltransferase
MFKGQRVTLRAVEREDLKRLHALEGNVDLMLLGGGSWEPEPLAAWEKDFDKHLEDREKSWFAIETDGKLIGGVGLHHTDHRSRVSSFGIVISDPEYVGRGYGREALTLFLGWAFRIQNFVRIWLITWATNERAIRCYRALGFVEEGRQRRQLFIDGQYADVIHMGLLREEWEARNQQ